MPRNTKVNRNMKRNGKHVFFRCGDCNFLHLGRVILCSKCSSKNILQETFDELPFDQFEMFSEHEKISNPEACCEICSQNCRKNGIDFYQIDGRIYCPEHYIKVKWILITYGLSLLDAEASISRSERIVIK